MTLHSIWITLFGGSLALAAGFAVPNLPNGLQSGPAQRAVTPPRPDAVPQVMTHTLALTSPSPAIASQSAAPQPVMMANPARGTPTRPATPRAEATPTAGTALTRIASSTQLGPPLAVEMMRAAAKDVSGPPRSQLDVILAALQTPTSPAAPKWHKPPPVQAATPATAPTPIRVSATPVRPKTRPQATETAASTPTQSNAPHDTRSFSAQHFQKLSQMAHPPPSSIACVAELQLISGRAQIYFDTGSIAMSASGTSAARLIAAKAQSCPEAEVQIVGFTDPGGTPEFNRKLSWQRANKVFRAIQEAGFNTGRIRVSSHMEDHPEDCVHYDSVDRRVIFDVREIPSE